MSIFSFSVIISSRLSVDADGTGNICINCTISSLSDALGCMVLLHPENDLSNITLREVSKSARQPYCIHVGGGNTFLLQSLSGKVMVLLASNQQF